LENREENCEMILKIWKESKLNSEKIWKESKLLSLFNLDFLHISKSFHYSIYFSSVFSKFVHCSTYILPYHFTIQPTFLNDMENMDEMWNDMEEKWKDMEIMEESQVE
jgi:hypothetical protein